MRLGVQQSTRCSPREVAREPARCIGAVNHKSLPSRPIRPAPRSNTVCTAALVGNDVVETASQLLEHATNATASIDTHSASDLLASIGHALQGHGFLDHVIASTSSAADAVLHHVSHSGLADQVASVLPDMTHAAVEVHDVVAAATASGAVQQLHDIAMAASSLPVDLPDVGSLASISSSLQGLSMWAAERLSVVQTIDASAFEGLRTSLGELLNAVHSVVQQHVAAESLPWTNALVLGVQQLVMALRMPAAGAASVQGMIAAQEAMQAAMVGASSSLVEAASAAGVSTALMPSGLGGLMQMVLAIVAMLVASLPRDSHAAHKAGEHAADAEGDDPVPTRYDVKALQDYFSRRPMLVLKRNAQVVSKLSAFGIAVLADWRMGMWETNMPERARWIRSICEELGPAYIKIAQAMSTRVDFVPEPYLTEFAKLQDNVPTFSTVEARRVLEEGLGRPVDTVFEWLSQEPLAAASLGQVYRGKLRPELGGAEVAVKVQRPGVLEAVALDVFVMRRAAVLFSQLPGMSDQWASVLDDWAERFFQEMDYTLEGHNTITFQRDMAGLAGVKVATVYPELTSRRVIISEWIQGERLGESRAEDIRALCSTLLNCYLIQLLETGLLHADPHPGNLLRTADGQIVILDFGLMTEVSEEQRIALVEFIAHLTVEDWEGVAKDLMVLGFMPAEGLPPDAATHIAPVLEQVMGKIVRGGGLRGGINITSIAGHLQEVAQDYKMCIPPYFALVLRAFSTIEGIALKVDPDYAIVSECMPYLSRRLLTDRNPRMRAALRQLLYGSGTRLDIERLQRIMGAFTAFTTAPAPSASGPTFSAAHAARSPSPSPAASPAPEEAGKRHQGGLLSGLLMGGDDSNGPLINEPMKEVLKVVFAKDGSIAQEILVDEAVAAFDAMSREAMSEALRMLLSGATSFAALRTSAALLGPLRAIVAPLPMMAMPLEGMMRSMVPVVALSAEDKQALSMIRALLDLLQPAGASPSSPIPALARAGSKALRVAGEVAPLLPELLPGMQATVELFVRQLIRRVALRLAEDLEAASKGSSGAASAASGAVAPKFTSVMTATGQGTRAQQQQQQAQK